MEKLHGSVQERLERLEKQPSAQIVFEVHIVSHIVIGSYRNPGFFFNGKKMSIRPEVWSSG